MHDNDVQCTKCERNARYVTQIIWLLFVIYFTTLTSYIPNLICASGIPIHDEVPTLHLHSYPTIPTLQTIIGNKKQAWLALVSSSDDF